MITHASAAALEEEKANLNAAKVEKKKTTRNLLKEKTDPGHQRGDSAGALSGKEKDQVSPQRDEESLDHDDSQNKIKETVPSPKISKKERGEDNAEKYVKGP